MALWHTMMMTFTAKDMASGIIARLERSLGGLGPAAGKAAKGVAGAFAALQGMQLGVGALRNFYDVTEGAGRFEQKLGQLKVAAQGADERFIQLAKTAALTAGFTSTSTASQAAEGMRELAKAGLEANDVLRMINPALKLVNASTGEIGAKEAAEFMAQMQNTFAGVGAPSPELAVNVAAKVAGESMADLKEVPGMFARAAGGAIVMKQAFTDVAAALGVVRGVVTESTTVGTTLRMIYQVLSSASGAQKLFEKTGVSVLDAAGKFKPLLLIMAQLQDSPAWKAMSGKDGLEQSEFLKKFFGSRQVGTVEAMMLKLEKGIKDVNGQVHYGVDAANMLSEAYKKASEQNLIDAYAIANINTFGGLIDFLATKLQTFSDTAGLAFVPVFRGIATVLNDVGRELGLFLLSIPDWVKEGAGKFVLFTTAAFTAAAAVGTLVFAFTALSAIWSVAGGFLMAVLIKPMLIALGVIAVLAVVGAAFYVAWKRNLGGFADFVTGSFGKVMLAVEAFKQLFTEGGTWGDVDAKLMDPKNSGVLVFVKQVWMWLGRLKAFAEGVWDGFVAALERAQIFEIVVNVFKELAGLLSLTDTSTAANVSTWERMAEIGRIVGTVLGWVANVVLYGVAAAIKAVNILVGAFGAVWWLVGPLVMSVVNMIWGLIKIFVGAVTLDFNLLANGIFTVFKGVGSFILNFFGTIFKFLGAGIDAIVGVFGFTPNFGMRVDQYFRGQDESLVAQKWGGGDHSFSQTPKPALGAIKGQAVTSAPAPPPVVNVTPTPVVLKMNGDAIANGVIKYQHGVDNRSFRPTPPVHSGLER